MTEHPSINHKSRHLKELTPKTNMKPDAPCWCLSEIAFKDCHFQRDKQQVLSPFEIEKEQKKRSSKGVCLHPKASSSECSGSSAISSHTIQKKGGLSAIAEDGHVLSTVPSLSDMIKFEGRPPLVKKGVQNASTFPGFCNKHDTELFASIESGSAKIDKGSAFLFALRAINLEFYRKITQLEAVKSQKLLDKGQPFWKQVALQQHLYAFEQGVLLGKRDIVNCKNKYDTVFLSNDLCNFHYYAVRFKTILPIAMCSAFQIESDFAGNVLQKLGNNNLEYEHATINITPSERGTIASVGFLGMSTGPASRFLTSFVGVPDHRKANALVRAAFELGENIFVRPSWWKSLPKAERDELEARRLSGTPARERTSRCLVNTGAHFLSAEIDEIVSG